MNTEELLITSLHPLAGSLTASNWVNVRHIYDFGSSWFIGRMNGQFLPLPFRSNIDGVSTRSLRMNERSMQNEQMIPEKKALAYDFLLVVILFDLGEKTQAHWFSRHHSCGFYSSYFFNRINFWWKQRVNVYREKILSFDFSFVLLNMGEFFFNIDHGYLEGLIRGFKSGLLTTTDYANLVQCETLEGTHFFN